MARRHRRPAASFARTLAPLGDRCVACGWVAPVAYHGRRTVATVDGLCHLTLIVRRCRNRTCPLHRRPYRPEAEGAIALPHGETGLDLIALVGALRFGEHRSVPKVHAALQERGIGVAERTVTNLVHRYEELVALRMGDQRFLGDRVREQGRVVLAIDGLQPDVGHEVLWVLRDCLSGEVPRARSLLSGREVDLVPLIQAVQQALPVPIVGVISDGQLSLRRAVATALPGVPISCASSTICGRRPCPSTRRIAMPRRNSRSRCAACGRSNGNSRHGRTTRRPRRCGAVAWQYAAP